MSTDFQRAVGFQVSPWPADNAPRWRELAEKAETVARKAGTSGSRFRDVVVHVRTLLANGAYGAVAERLGDRQVMRALLTVWADDDALAWASMPRLFPEARIRLLEHPSRISATILAALFWRHFDHLDAAQPGLTAAVGRTLHEVAAGLQREGIDDGGPLGAIVREPQFWIAQDGPAALAQHLIAAGRTLDDHLGRNGISGLEGRFGILARHEYYLVQIRQADHTAGGHVFLADISREEVKAAEAGNGLSFGHALLQALCDKPANQDPSPQWREALLTIGGDPRYREREDWRRWWAHVPPHLTERAARWMAGADLNIYFEALDTYARDHGKEEMRRMLPARTTFLRGLYHSNLVRDVRLILGDGVRTGMRSQLTGIDARRLTGQGSSETAVVLLVCDDFTVVEGSHNFQIYLYAGDPVPMLVDPRRRTYSLDDLKKQVPALYEREHGGQQDGQFISPHVSFRHRSIWQPQAIEFLRSIGVAIDARTVLSSADYEKHRLRELRASNATRYSRRGW